MYLADSIYDFQVVLRQKLSDRAILRALHFFGENERVEKQAQALKEGDFERFKTLVIESGYSSFMRLQNVFIGSKPQRQGLSLALAISDLLKGPWSLESSRRRWIHEERCRRMFRKDLEQETYKK